MTNNWEMKRLDEIAILNPPKPKGIDAHLAVSFIGMADVSTTGKIIETSIREFRDTEKGYTAFQEGDVLLAKITPCFENGKCALAAGLNHGLGIGSTEFHVLRMKDGMDPRFLLYHTRSSAFRIRGEANMTGTSGQKRVPADFIKAFRIPVPPLVTQQTIIRILEAWDTALHLTEILIQKKKSLIRAILSAAIATSNGSWQKASLGNLASVIMGQAPASRFYNKKKEGLPLIQGKADLNGNSTNANIWTSQITKTCEAGDILMTVRAPVGAVARSSGRACLGRGVCAIKPHAVDRDFLFFILRHLETGWGKYIQGSIFAAVSSIDVKRMVVPFPKSGDEQAVIAAALKAVDAEISLLEQQTDYLQKQRNGLLNRLLYPGLSPHGPGERL